MTYEHILKIYFRKKHVDFDVLEVRLSDSTSGGGTTPTMWIRRVRDEGGMYCFEDGHVKSFVPWHQITHIAIES